MLLSGETPMAADRSPIEDVSYCLRGATNLPCNGQEWCIMKGSIVTFGIGGALAFALTATTSFAQASYADNSNLNAKNSLLMLVRAGGGGGGGGGGHGGGGGGHGGGFGGGGFGRGGFGFSGGHVGGMGHGSRMGGMGHIHGGHGFHGGHLRHHHRSRFFGYSDDYGCWWSQRYHRWVCPGY
jgi:hypothetical protein